MKFLIKTPIFKLQLRCVKCTICGININKNNTKCSACK